VLQRELLARSLRIVLVGLVLHAVAHVVLDTPAFRPLGVLQRIGVCVAVAGVLAIRTRPRTQWGAVVVILLGYWLLMVAGGPLTREGNLASRVDTALLGRYAYEFDAASGRAHDPEGLLATIPAIATTLLGLRAGDWLRQRRLRRLVAAAAVSLALGGAWSLVFPLNKALWTSSYVLWTGGWAMLALAAAHVAIDRWRWPAWGRSLGLNALAVYAGAWLMVCLLDATGAGRWLHANAIVPMTPGGGPYVASLAYALAVVALWWSVATVLARRGVRIKL
jgi:predicted acyltransferase